PRFAALLQPVKRFSIYHGSNGLREPDCDVSRAGVWPVADKAFARTADRPVHPRGGAAGTSEKGRHSNNGRRAHRFIDSRAHAAVGRFDQSFYSAFTFCADRFCNHRFHRRLRENFQAEKPWAHSEKEDLFSSAGQFGRRDFAARSRDALRVLDTVDDSVSQALAAGPCYSFLDEFAAPVAFGVSAVSVFR